MTKRADNLTKDRGYILLVATILLALASMLIATALRQNATASKTMHATELRSRDYFQAEAAISQSISWLRQHSQKLITPYRRDNFYTVFERVDSAAGDNDLSDYQVPTRIRLKDTTNSAIIMTDDSLATSAFPETIDITDNSVFDPASEFTSLGLDDAMVRITLLDAIAVDPDADSGPPPNPEPETDFYPVYRIDAMNSLTEGAHVYATVTGNLAHLFDYGIYGENNLEILQPCDSYSSSDGQYSSGIKKANCPAASNSTAAIHKNEEIYGSLATNGNINASPPYGGETCADFTAGCPNKGETCAGEECGVPLLEQFEDWTTYCPTDQGNLVLSTDTTLTVATEAPADSCWNSLVIRNNTTVTLETTDYPYFIRTLAFQNNSNSQLDISPDPEDGTIELYVLNITGNTFNGNQMLNADGRPVNFRLYYLGTNALTLNGSANMNAALVCPNAALTVSGNFDFSGALIAKELYLQGSGSIHYDEDLGGDGPVNDIQYKIKELVQYYR